jgi:hypothetical protein
MTFMTYDEELATIYAVHEVNDYEGWTSAGAISRCLYGATTFSIMTLSITTFSITTLSIRGLYVTPSIITSQH